MLNINSGNHLLPTSQMVAKVGQGVNIPLLVIPAQAHSAGLKLAVSKETPLKVSPMTGCQQDLLH